MGGKAFAVQRYQFEDAQGAPGDVLADEVNLKLTFSLSPRLLRAARRCEEARITRLFLQRRELRMRSTRSIKQPRKGCQKALQGRTDAHDEGKRL